MSLVFLPLSFVAGFLEPGLMKGPILSGVLSIAYVIATIYFLLRWVQRDSAQRNANVSWGFRIMLVVLTAFALPYYFFKSRGAWGGAKLLGQAWLIFIGSMICYRIGYAL